MERDEMVEQAFEDGNGYATNVSNPDPDVAGQHSKVRALLSDKDKP
jgi:hypothetical protein